MLTDDVNSLVGILTERDFLTKIAGRPHYDDEPIADYMTRHPETVRATDTISYALGKMAGGGYRHLPVVAGKSPVGIVSVRDVLKHMTSLCNDSVS